MWTGSSQKIVSAVTPSQTETAQVQTVMPTPPPSKLPMPPSPGKPSIKYHTVVLGVQPSSQQEISGQGVQNIVAQGLIVEGAARTGLLIAGPANQNASAQNPTENIVIRRVVARNNVGGNNAGIKFSAGGGGRHLLVKNIVLNNDGYSFEGSSPSLRLRNYYPSKLYHNLAYNGGSFGFSLAANYTPAPGFEIFHLRNNIALDNAGEDIFGEQVGKTDSDYNFISDAAELADLQKDGFDLHSITGDAQLGNPSLVIDTNFDPSWTVEEKLEHIRSQIRSAFCPNGSNLVDKGALIDGYHNTGSGDETGEDGAVWYGNAPDIGACETAE